MMPTIIAIVVVMIGSIVGGFIAGRDYGRHNARKEEQDMSIELQRQYLAEIKAEIENIDRILNRDNTKIRDEILIKLYRDLEL